MQIQFIGDCFERLYTGDTIAMRIQAWGISRYPHLPGYHSQYSAAHTTFCRQADAVTPFTGKIVHPTGA